MNTNMPFGINPNMMPNNFQSGYDYNLIEQRLQTLERKVQAIEKKLNNTNSTPNNLDYNYNYTSSMHMM